MAMAKTRRIYWLDGVRAVAAVYVMLHHIWLAAFPRFPHDAGPWLVGWMLYGHLGVAIFIVVSGYSLMLKPVRHDTRLAKGVRRFAADRAWRILPPYWISLVGSLLIVDLAMSPPPGQYAGIKSLVVHGFLLQDVFGSVTPNGAFWSIAVECQIYLLFPLLLWACRRWGPIVTSCLAALLVSAAHLLADRVALFSRINNFTPALLILFVFGMAAASPSLQAKLRGLPAMVPLMLGAVFVSVIALLGPVATVRNYFWIDIFAGVVLSAVLVYLTLRPQAPVARLLQKRPLVAGGEMSYSLYLVHAPIIGLLWLYVVHPHVASPVPAFLAELLLGVPLCFIAAYGFYLAFERPFLTIRSWSAFGEAARRRLRPSQGEPWPSGSAPAPASAPVPLSRE